MRSGQVGHGQAWLACALAVLAWLYAASAHAQATVVYAGMPDAELFARIRGQTRDLPIVLHQTPSRAPRKPDSAELRALADQTDAELVVTVERLPSGAHAVYVYDAATGELRTRMAPAARRHDRFARSAAAETIALIVRGELSDALANRRTNAPVAPGSTQSGVASAKGEGAPGQSRANRTDGTTDTSGPRPSQAPTGVAGSASARQPDKSVRAPPIEPPPGGSRATSQPQQQRPAFESQGGDQPQENENQASSEGAETDDEIRDDRDEGQEQDEAQERDNRPWLSQVAFSIAVGGRLSTPSAERFLFGPALGLHLRLGNLSVGVVGTTSTSSRAEIQRLRIGLREHSVGLEILGTFSVLRGLALGIGGAGRWLLYQRETSSSDPNWVPQPARTLTSIALGPLLQLRWEPLGFLGLDVRIGLDGVLSPLSLRYATNELGPGDAVELERQRRWEPWVALGVFYTP